MTRTAFLWGLLVLLCHQAVVTSHVLGRSYSSSDLAQLQNLLERFEQALVSAAQAEDSPDDYEGTDPDPERSPEGQISLPLDPQGPEGGQSRTQSQRSRLQDLLLATRSKTRSGCFGGRLDRIGSSSNLGCNPTKG